MQTESDINAEKKYLFLETTGALRHKVKTRQHDEHGRSNAKPKTSHEYLPDYKSLSGCQADHDAQPVDDVKDDRAYGKQQRQELEDW